MTDHSDDIFPDGTRVVREGEIAPTPATDDLVGQTLEGRYQIKKKIGVGGMATVYLAGYGNLDRPAAVKVPLAALLANPAVRERFEREVRSLVRFEHPGVVKILDAGRVGETPFMVMEYLPGGSLAEQLAAAPMRRQTPAQVLKWLVPLAKTLDSLHEKGLIHRDVKADNILFDAANQPCLADFGVAKALQAGDGTLTNADMALGSVRTMAPEQCLDEEITGAADQYALAATVYEALSGRPVFGGKAVQVLTKKATRDAPPIGPHVPGLPAAAAAAIMRGLSREPSARLSSCAALARAFRDGLRVFKQPEPISVPVADRAPRRAPKPRAGSVPSHTSHTFRNRVIALLVLLCVAVGAWALLGGAGSDKEGSGESSNPPSIANKDASKDTPPSKPPEAFEATLAAAEAAAGKEAWREASRLLDLATSQGLPKGRASRTLLQGVERWKAPPTLKIISPGDGAEIKGLTVRLAGRLETGRSDDRLVVDGNAVPLETGGRFLVSLPYAKAGTYRIGIDVLDDKGGRRGGEMRTVTLLPSVLPVLSIPSWARVSVEQKREASRLSVPVAFENDLGMRFVLIPAGEFWMGSPGTEKERGEDETRHRVKLAEAYYLQITEVTNGQYRRKEGAHESYFTGPKQPVDTVSWNDATAYAKWLSSRDVKRTYVLPTEAEWEYACRAGARTPFAFGETISPSQANYDGDYTYGRGRKGDDRKKTIDVGTLAHNGWGLYDMHGNVHEWCQDRYGDYSSRPLTIDPTGSSSGYGRVVRGGSWDNEPRYVRSAYRDGFDPHYRNFLLGFRLVVRLRP